jgi:hypothetical protein
LAAAISPAGRATTFSCSPLFADGWMRAEVNIKIHLRGFDAIFVSSVPPGFAYAKLSNLFVIVWWRAPNYAVLYAIFVAKIAAMESALKINKKECFCSILDVLLCHCS